MMDGYHGEIRKGDVFKLPSMSGGPEVEGVVHAVSDGDVLLRCGPGMQSVTIPLTALRADWQFLASQGGPLLVPRVGP